MPYEKRRIIEVHFPVSEFESQIHPAVILSVEEIYNHEKYYLCAMISTTKQVDKFSFTLSQNDTTNGLRDGSQIRTNLIAQILDEDINSDSPINFIHEHKFLELIDHIDEFVFGVPFEI
jgi:hypothetical protein